MTQLVAKQLFSTEEKCLPFGRQVLAFNLDFSVTQSQTVGPQLLASPRPYVGIKGLFLQGSNSGYAIKSANYANSGGQVLVSPTTKFAYTFDGTNLQQLGSTVEIPISNLPAGISLPGVITVNQDALGTQNNCMFGSDGFLYALGTNAAFAIYILRIDPSTAKVVASVEAASTTGTFASDNVSFTIYNDKIYVAYDYNVSGVATASITQVAISTLAIVATYNSVGSGFEANICSLFPDSSGNILMLRYPTNPNVTYQLDIVIPASMTGNYVDISAGFKNNEQPYGAFGNNNGGFDVYIPTGGMSRFDAPNYALGLSATGLGNTNPFFLNFIATENGNPFFYLSDISDAGIVTIYQYDSETFALITTYSLAPYLGNVTPYRYYFNPTNGDIFLSSGGGGNIVQYALQTSVDLTVQVNGTGQLISLPNVTAGFSAWLPLMALESDTVTFSAASGSIQGFLTNFDVHPFILGV